MPPSDKFLFQGLSGAYAYKGLALTPMTTAKRSEKASLDQTGSSTRPPQLDPQLLVELRGIVESVLHWRLYIIGNSVGISILETNTAKAGMASGRTSSKNSACWLLYNHTFCQGRFWSTILPRYNNSASINGARRDAEQTSVFQLLGRIWANIHQHVMLHARHRRQAFLVVLSFEL